MFSFLMPLYYQIFSLESLAKVAPQGRYGVLLMVLAYLVSCLGAFAAVKLSEDMQNSRIQIRQNIMHLSAAFCLSGAIWAMHFIAIFSHAHIEIPDLGLLYALFGMLFAFGVSYWSLSILASGKLKPTRIFFISAILSCCAVITHLLCMAPFDLHEFWVESASVSIVSGLVTFCFLYLGLFLYSHLKCGSDSPLMSVMYAGFIIGTAFYLGHFINILAPSLHSDVHGVNLESIYPRTQVGLAIVVSVTSIIIFVSALTVGLTHKKIGLYRSSTTYSGNSVLVQLTWLLGMFLALTIISYTFMHDAQNETQAGKHRLSAASLQRTFLSRYVYNVSQILLGIESRNWNQVAIHSTEMQKQARLIDQNYTGMIKGGRVLIDITERQGGYENVSNLADGEILDALILSKQRWNILKKMSEELIERKKENAARSTPDNLNQRYEDALRAQNNVVNIMHKYTDTIYTSLESKEKIILLLDVFMFLITVLYAKLFIANRIDNSRKQLEKYQDNLENLVAEQTRDLVRANRQMQEYTEELEDARELAEEANRTKSDFLANMSHEIRTPMNAVLGMSNLLMEADLNKEHQEWVKAIYSSGENLLKIINDVIDISKIEAGKLVLEETDMDLFEVIHDVTNLFAYQAREKGLEVIVKTQLDQTHGYKGDPVRIKQIFSNLISNAIKFTFEGHILVKVKEFERDDETVDIACWIEDTGVGIAQEKHQLIFEKFSQAEESTTRKFGGTGLGLTIVSELIELMSGTICVESNVQKGSTFIFNIVLKKGKAHEVRDIDVNISGLTALVVDDYSMMNDFIQQILKDAFMDVSAASGEHVVIDLLEKDQHFDVYVIDYDLRHSNGLDLVQKIKEKSPDSLFILITGAVESISYDELKKKGVHVFLKKPFRSTELINVIKLAKQQTEQGDDNELITRYDVAISSVMEKRARDRNTITQYPGAKVLAVEDMKMNMMLIKKVLSKFGVDLDTAENGREALNQMKTVDYDIVFMDCQMPEMDGFEATQEIRKYEQRKGKNEVPIVALTADAMIGDRDKCLSIGMNDYINKPFKEAEIAAALERWVGS